MTRRILLLSLLLAAAAGVVLLRVEIANRLVPWYLTRELGVPVEVVLGAFDAGTIRIERLAVGSGRQLLATDVSVGIDALGGRLLSVEIGQVDLLASYGSTFSLGELDPVLERLRSLPGGGGTGGLPTILVRNIALAITTPAGPITGHGELTVENAAIVTSFTLSEGADLARVGIDLAAPLSEAARSGKVTTGEVTARIGATSALWRLAGLQQPSGGSLALTAELKPVPDTGAAGGALALVDWELDAADFGYPGLAAPLSGTLAGTAAYGDSWLELRNLAGKAAGGALADLALALSGSLRLDEADGTQALQGSLRLEGGSGDFAGAGILLKKPHASFDLVLDGKRESSGTATLDIALQKPGSLTSQGIVAGVAGTIAKPPALTVTPGKATWIHAAYAPAAGLSAEFSLALGKAAMALDPKAATGHLLLAMPAAVITGRFAPPEPMRMGFEATGMQVGAPERGLVLGNVALSLAADGSGLKARFSSGALTGLGSFLPVKAAGEATLAGGKLAFSGHFTGIDQPFDLVLGGKADTGKGSGSLDVTLAPLVFAPGSLQPYNLFPALRDYFDDISGTVELKGPVTFSGGKFTSALKLGVSGFSGKVGPVQLANVNSVVEIDSPWPLSTRPDQTVAIERADIGLPLSDALFRFKISDGRRLDLAESRLVMAGGRVSLDPAALTFDAPAQNLRLKVEALSVAQLFASLGIAGLSGEGSISGEVPVTIFPGGIAIPAAKLQATEPGVLRYDRNQAPPALQSAGASVAMALEALADFHYEKLILDLTRNLTGDVTLGLHIAGRNPSFYDGYPVEFNLTIQGRLDQALKEGLAGYQVPDMIQQQLDRLSP